MYIENSVKYCCIPPWNGLLSVCDHVYNHSSAISIQRWIRKPQLQHLTLQIKSRSSLNFKFVGSNIPKSLLECCTGSVSVCVLEHMFVFSSVCKSLLKCCGRFNSCWCSQ